MRYGNPGPGSAFDALLQRDPAIEEVIALPLYPHYAMSSYETAVEYANTIQNKVVLIDGARLAELMFETGLGLSIVTSYEVKKIDADYFLEDEAAQGVAAGS